nr:extensin-like [Lolium perenne]
MPTMSSGSTSLPCNPLCPPLPERKPTRVRQRAPRVAQAMPITAWTRPSARHGHLPPRRPAQPLAPPLCTLSITVAAPIHQTRSRALALLVADDQLAGPPNFPPSSEPPRPLYTPHCSPPPPNCHLTARVPPQSNPTLPSTPGAPATTVEFAIVDTVALHQRHHSPTFQLAADPLPPPRQQAPPLDGDDTPRSHDLLLIQRSSAPRTDSYADDTLLILPADEVQLLFLKDLLIDFGNATRLRVNYDKSNLIPINISEDRL